MMPETQNLIKNLLNLTPNNKRVFVFDIDSTLYDVTPRNQEIVRDFGHTSDLLEPSLKDTLKSFNSESNDWGIKAGLMRLNLPLLNRLLIDSIKEHWNQFFFSDKFLHLDQVYPGAIDFVQALNKISPVYYLTGRDIARMGAGTIEQLKASNFPLDSQRDKLILKPEKSLLDHDYKVEELKKLTEDFSEIHFFENEPVILNAVHDQLPDVKLYYVESVNSGRAEIYSHIQVIKPHYIFK